MHRNLNIVHVAVQGGLLCRPVARSSPSPGLCTGSAASLRPRGLTASQVSPRRRRIELIQDMHFPSACVRIKLTPDGQHMLATGTHPPQLRVFDLTQMAMKFDRHFDSEIVDFQVLADRRGLPGAHGRETGVLLTRALMQLLSDIPAPSRAPRFSARTTASSRSSALTAASHSTPSMAHTTASGEREGRGQRAQRCASCRRQLRLGSLTQASRGAVCMSGPPLMTRVLMATSVP